MIKNIITATPILFSLLFVGIFAFPERVSALPAFTRAHNVECTTCHTIFPELNEYGEAFLKNGYVFFGTDKKKSAEKIKATSSTLVAKPAVAPVADNVVKGAGDADLLNKLKAGTMISADAPETAAVPAQAVDDGRMKSEGLLISGIPEQLPISFTANIHGSYDRNAVNEFDFSTRTLKLNAGGNFKEKVGFFGTYILYTENSAGISNTSQTPTNMTGKDDIVELFIIGRHIFDTPINIKVGRFQPKLGLWKSNNKLSITNSYDTYAYTVGSSYFRIEQPQDAIEANMIFGTRLFFAGGVVNRKEQNTKEWYLHTSVKVGGADYLVNEPEIDLNKEETVFDFLTLTVGGYGYVGTNGDPNTVAGATPRQNDFYRAGVDIDLIYKLYRLKMSGVVGNDDNPDLTYTLPEVKSYVTAIEGQYTIQQNLIAALRFEYQDDGTNIVRRYIPTIAYAPIENLKVVAEYKHESGTSYKSAATTEIDNKIGTLGVTFGF
ncbi:MAG: hypothetical protein PHF56_04900 [Desulfuromonadaceae bacterium]|nr:hypothetical protein [Desulfuromonadaceae bacterium]